jgi:hypothetical protein
MIGYEYRRLGSEELYQLDDLQKRNLRSDLDLSERSAGFLSGAIAREDIIAMNRDLAVIVCLDKSELLGFLCASSLDFNRKLPLPAKMIDRLGVIDFHGRKIDSLDSFVAGPVCVEKDKRGQGIFSGLYENLFVTTKDRFDLAVSLIDITNEPSLKAHQKIGYEIVDMFGHDGQEFYTVTLPLQRFYRTGDEKQPASD